MYNFMDGDAPLAPCTLEETKQLRVVYFKLRFDYYINSAWVMDPFYESIIR